MTRKYVKRQFNHDGLDALHRSDPDRSFSLDEIAEAAGIPRQTVWVIEQRAIRKMREEFIRRGIIAGSDLK